MSDASGVRSGGLEISGLCRSFVQGGKRLDVLRELSLTVPPGKLVALVGPSGAGKSTLLHAAGLLEKPDAGEIKVDGVVASGLNDRRRTALRSSTIGFVYQYHHLLPEFSALENIVLPQMIAGISKKEAKARAGELLERVGLSNRADHRPGQLSGGEQQRVAIARGLANKPAVLLADEPTGNLDPDTGARVFKLLHEIVHETKLAALIATHNLDLAARMDAILRLDHGQIEETQRAASTSTPPTIITPDVPDESPQKDAGAIGGDWDDIVLPPEVAAAVGPVVGAGDVESESGQAPAPEEEASHLAGPSPTMEPVRDPVHFPEPMPVPDPPQGTEDEPEAAPESEESADASAEISADKPKKVWNISIKK